MILQTSGKTKFPVLHLNRAGSVTSPTEDELTQHSKKRSWLALTILRKSGFISAHGLKIRWWKSYSWKWLRLWKKVLLFYYTSLFFIEHLGCSASHFLWSGECTLVSRKVLSGLLQIAFPCSKGKVCNQECFSYRNPRAPHGFSFLELSPPNTRSGCNVSFKTVLWSLSFWPH